MSIRGNERSAVIELISDINVFISDRDIIIKRAGGELTLTGNPTALFPDIMLFSDTARTHVLQGWEAKMPDVPITDETLIDNATQKAILLGTNSFVLWNFKAARLYIKGQTGNYSIIKGWDVPEIVSREDVDRYEANWKRILHNILLEINEFLLNGLLVATNVENILSENIGSMLLKRNKNVVADFINNSSLTDTRISAFLTGWWRTYSAEYNNDETDVTIFVSYKYHDTDVQKITNNYWYQDTVRDYVDQLQSYFDNTDDIYKGEDDGEDLSQLSEEAIWSQLKDRIYDSTLTIVMILSIFLIQKIIFIITIFLSYFFHYTIMTLWVIIIINEPYLG